MTTDTDAPQAPLSRESTLAFHPLASRVDGQEVVIGRTDAGDFIALPAIGATAITALRERSTIGEVEHRLREATGEDIDVLDLAEQLVELGFVATIDDHPLASRPPIRNTLPWLKPGHVRWLLTPPAHTLTNAIPLLLASAAIATLALGLVPVPNYRSLLWSDHGSVLVLTQAAIGWGLVLVHELAHLATARAAGVPGHIEFGTRLQFLVAQTNVTGIWAAPRRHRLAVYTAGMKLDATIGSAALIASAILPADGLAHRLALVVVIFAVSGLVMELLIFMRTDVYFVVQDLTGSRNLYGDGSAHTRYLAGRIAARLRGRGAPPDPLANLTRQERNVVRWYTGLLVTGTLACLALGALIVLPYNIGLISGAIASISSSQIGGLIDGLVVLALLSTVATIWARAWWSRHGAKLCRRPRGA